MPAVIPGVIGLCGALVPFIDFNPCLGRLQTNMSRHPRPFTVEVQGEEDTDFPGITVDAVTAVRHIDINNIEPTPSFGAHIRVVFLNGMAKVNGSFVSLLDSGKVLSLDEISLLQGMTASIHPSAEG